MKHDPSPADDGWVYVPAPPDTRVYEELGTLTVDGEVFCVRSSDDDGSIHYDWLSGPNDGYGFSVLGGRLSKKQQVADIRDFLSGIDPATGYLADP